MLQYLLTLLLSSLAVNQTTEEYEKNQKDHAGILKPPRFAFILGAISMVVWAVLLMMVLLFAKDAAALILCAVLFGILFALGLFLVLYGRNFLVTYKDGKIIYRNLFRITRTFDCQHIEHAYYTDEGGIKLIFQNGKKLSFAKEEKYFYKEIIKREHLKCQFKGEESATIQVRLHPCFMYPLWFVSCCTLFFSLLNPTLFPYAIVILVICIGNQMSSTTYNQESKILICRKCGFSKQYDMHVCSAKPFYRKGFLMEIEIYETNKKVAKIPVSRDYQNRARLVHVLCGLDV